MKAGRWMKELTEAAGLLGLEPVADSRWNNDTGHATVVIALKAKGSRGRVFKIERDRWNREREVYGACPVKPGTALADAADETEEAARLALADMSGKELVVRSSAEKVKSPYGFTCVRLERHIRLPEFASAGELRLKLECSEQ